MSAFSFIDFRVIDTRVAWNICSWTHFSLYMNSNECICILITRSFFLGPELSNSSSSSSGNTKATTFGRCAQIYGQCWTEIAHPKPFEFIVCNYFFFKLRRTRNEEKKSLHNLWLNSLRLKCLLGYCVMTPAVVNSMLLLFVFFCCFVYLFSRRNGIPSTAIFTSNSNSLNIA